MSMNVYSVLWADDECDSLRKDLMIRKALDNSNIEVLDWLHTSEELKDKLELLYDKVDAVIVDGNFSKKEVPFVEKEDISGLMHTISFIDAFNIKRDIPFFLYTGRDALLQQVCKNQELDYFLENDRLIQKGNVGQLFENIINSVDHIKSVEYSVKKQYASLLTMANKVSPVCKEKLHSFLLDEARDTRFDKAKDMFTALRQILEQILNGCRSNDIVPGQIDSLNKFGYFWSRKNGFEIKASDRKTVIASYKPKDDELMPNPVSLTLENLIKLTQDGSHQIEGLNLKVTDYVHNIQSPFLFRSCLYQIMDLIQWYNSTLTELVDGTIKTPLYNEYKNTI